MTDTNTRQFVSRDLAFQKQAPLTPEEVVRVDALLAQGESAPNVTKIIQVRRAIRAPVKRVRAPRDRGMQVFYTREEQHVLYMAVAHLISTGQIAVRHARRLLEKLEGK